MQAQTQVRNGLDLDQRQQTVDATTNDPTLAGFEFRANNRWIDGGHNRSTIQGFYGARTEDSSRVDADATDAEIEDLIAFTRAHSPVCNTVCQPVPVELKLVD